MGKKQNINKKKIVYETLLDKKNLYLFFVYSSAVNIIFKINCL